MKNNTKNAKKWLLLQNLAKELTSNTKKLTQDIHNTHEFKYSQKLLRNTFQLRPIWDQWLKPFRNESNLKEDRSSEKFCQFDNSMVTEPVPHVFRGSDSCKKAPEVTNHQMLTYYLQNEPWQR